MKDLNNPLDKLDNLTSDQPPQPQQQPVAGMPPQTVQQPQPTGQQPQATAQPQYNPPAQGYNQPAQQQYPQQQPAPPAGMPPQTVQPQLGQQPMQQASQLDQSVGPSGKSVGKIMQLLIFIYVFIAALLIFRFSLSLFAADTSSVFVGFVYDISSPFMIPFEGMFGAPIGAGAYRIEFEVLVALVVYALVFFGLARLVKIIFR